MNSLKPSGALSLPPHMANSPSQEFTIYKESDLQVDCNEAYRWFCKANSDLYEATIGRMNAWIQARVSRHQSASGEVFELRLSTVLRDWLSLHIRGSNKEL